MNKKIQKLYFLTILLFCSSVNAFENTDDSTATLKQLNGIQAGAIHDLRRKELQLQDELKKKEQELEDSQSNSSNTSDNSHSSSNTGPRTTRGDNVSPEPYISNNRNTQDNASNSKVYVNDAKNFDIIKVPNITDPVQKPNPSQTNQSQSAVLGDLNQQELMLGDNKQSNNQIDQLDSDGEPLETHENTSKFELLQSDTNEAEAKLLELQTKEDDLNNAFMKKKLEFEELEQLRSQLPKQLEIKDNSLNQLQNQEVQKNVVENIKFLNNEIEEKKTALKQPITNHHTELKKQESQSVKKIQGKIKGNSKKTEENTKNQPTTLSAANDLGYNKLNADLQTKLDEAKKDHERVQQELENKKEENKYLQEQITTLGKDKDGLEKDLLDAKNKAEALTIAQQVKGDALKALQDQLAAAVKDHKEKEKQFVGQIADLNQAHAEQDALVKAKEEELKKLQEAQTKEKQEALKEQARLAEAVEARDKQIADLTEEKAKKRSANSRLVSNSERYDSSKG
ncbi:hypothetical protein J6590_106461 [Homalodisca vitripennis]|nr:hypothetical protein J6590_106461 [Homalodisca vitripennis]